MYQGPPVKMWVTNIFYSGPYALVSLEPWNGEAPAASFAASNFFVSTYFYQSYHT